MGGSRFFERDGPVAWEMPYQFRHYRKSDDSPDLVQSLDYREPLYRTRRTSLIEGYVRNELSLHVHLAFRLEIAVEPSNYCVFFDWPGDDHELFKA